MIKYALENPVKVLVAVFFVVLFGVQAALNMPYRLIPNIEYPQITIRTTWTGASPYDMEKEIIDRQERVLKSIPGLIEFESAAMEGRCNVKLTFDLSVNVDDAILLVSNKLDEVKGYPDDMDKPTIRSADSDSFASVELMLTTRDGNTRSVDEYLSYFEEVIKPYIERVQGVADMWYWGGRAKQVQIIVDPYKMGAYNISLSQIINAVKKENIDVSAGTRAYGAKNYRFRTIGEGKTPDDIANIVIVSSDNSRLKLGDVAHVDYGYEKKDAFVRYNNKNAMNIGIIAQAGYNILDLTNDLEKVINDLNNTILKDNGIEFIWVSDQRGYILNAVSLVKSNIIAGGLLAVIVLLIFLRSIRSTLVIATTIPICIIGTFFIMNALGRSLNVISLAGIAFSVGMLIDNSIVVLENIDRHMKMGKKAVLAAYDAVREVWGAILASTLTTIAVFLPIVFIKEEAGQLFGDIAIAVSSSVGLSLITSVFVIPVATKVIYEKTDKFKFNSHSKFHNKIQHFNETVGNIGSKIVNFTVSVSDKINAKVSTRIIFVTCLTAVSLISAYILMPKMDYLPLGNKNMIETKLTVPPGISLAERRKIGNFFYKELEPYMQQDLDGYPRINTFGFAGGANVRAILTSTDEQRAGDYKPLLQNIVNQIPGIRGSTSQSPLFKVGGGQGNEFKMNVSGNMSYDQLISIVQLIQVRIYQEMADVQMQISPSANPVYPEVQLNPDREAIMASGLTTEEVGVAVDVYLDGRKIGEFKDPEIGTIDISLRGPYGEKETGNMETNPVEVSEFVVNSSTGLAVPVANLFDVKEVLSVERIRRFNSQRAFEFKIILQKGMVLEELRDNIMNKVIEPMRAEGLLNGIIISTSGASSKLENAKNALSGNFILAVIITYFLMAALLNNFLYPLIILFSIPLAATGGFMGLALTDLFIAEQPLDIITMLGFIMLVGTVVNNPILIVYQSLNYIKLGMNGKAAVRLALKTRIRPISMSTATSLFGMLPLVIAPGAGSELYRGMGSVILGGLALATVFTMFVIPALLSFFLDKVSGNDHLPEGYVDD